MALDGANTYATVRIIRDGEGNTDEVSVKNHRASFGGVERKDSMVLSWRHSHCWVPHEEFRNTQRMTSQR